MGALGSSSPCAVMGSLLEACFCQFNCDLDQERTEAPSTLYSSEVQGYEPVSGHRTALSPSPCQVYVILLCPPGPYLSKGQLG